MGWWHEGWHYRPWHTCRRDYSLRLLPLLQRRASFFGLAGQPHIPVTMSQLPVGAMYEQNVDVAIQAE